MDEILHLTLLYDFYGELLTEKQKQVFDLHYQDDLSLSEIGEELSISRQAVRDQLKRSSTFSILLNGITTSRLLFLLIIKSWSK